MQNYFLAILTKLAEHGSLSLNELQLFTDTPRETLLNCIKQIESMNLINSRHYVAITKEGYDWLEKLYKHRDEDEYYDVDGVVEVLRDIHNKYNPNDEFECSDIQTQIRGTISHCLDALHLCGYIKRKELSSVDTWTPHYIYSINPDKDVLEILEEF